MLVRREWWTFLDLIALDDKKRRIFFNEYKKIKEEGFVITTEAELDRLIEQASENNHPLLKDVADIYRELVKQGNSLRDFLDAGAQQIFERIQKMEEHRRAIDTAKLPPEVEQGKELLRLLLEGKIEQFNELRAQRNIISPKLSRATFSLAVLSGVNLSAADLSHIKFSRANLSRANLSYTDLLAADLSYADLSYTNLSYADLHHSIIIDVEDIVMVL